MEKPMTTAQLFYRIKNILREKDKLPYILQYGIATEDPVPIRTSKFELRYNLTYSEIRGIYLHLWIEYFDKNERCSRGIGTFKTMKDDDTAMHMMATLLADFIIEGSIFIASLLKMQGEDWTKNHYLSLGGTAPRALLQFLHDHPAVTCVSLCLDNDRAGILGMEKIREAVQADTELSKRIRVIVDNPPPVFCGKDYNELLLQKTAAKSAARNRERVQAGRGCGMEK